MWLVERGIDVILSVYLFNEKRGYLYLDQLAVAFSTKYPEERAMLASIRKHAADERHHHSLFEGYFLRKGRGPFEITAWWGYCDQMVQAIFRRGLDQLNPSEVVADDAKFFQLCRLIMITEMRGMQQVNLLLQSLFVRGRPDLVSIFSVVKRDEPAHCYPYQAWLRRHGQHEPLWRERWADYVTHYSLLLFKIPLLLLNPLLKRAEMPGKLPSGALAGNGTSGV